MAKSKKTVTGLMVAEQQALADQLGISVMDVKDHFIYTGALPTSASSIHTGSSPSTISNLFPAPPGAAPLPTTPVVGPVQPTPTPTPTPIAPDPYNPDMSSGLNPLGPISGAQDIKHTLYELLDNSGVEFTKEQYQAIHTALMGVADDGYFSSQEQSDIRDVLMAFGMAMNTNTVINTIAEVLTAAGVTMTGPNAVVMGGDVDLDNFSDFSDLNDAFTPNTGGDGNGSGGNGSGGNGSGGNGSGGNGSGGNNIPGIKPPKSVVDIDADGKDLIKYWQNYGDYIDKAKDRAKDFGDDIADNYNAQAFDEEGNRVTLMGIGQNNFENAYEKHTERLDQIKMDYNYMMMAPKFDTYTKTFENIKRIYDDSVSALESRTGLMYDKDSRAMRSQDRIGMIGSGNKDFNPSGNKNVGLNLISMYML